MTTSRYMIQTSDEQTHRLHLNGPAAHAVLQAVDEFLRSNIKHSDDETKAAHYQDIRDRLWEELRCESIDLWV